MLPASLRANYVREVRKCGALAFREQQSWRLLDEAAAAAAEASAASWREAVPAPLVAAHGGLWTPDETQGRPFAELSSEEREAILEQIEGAIQRTHHFVHYNGLTAASLSELTEGDENRFDDAVVVIDEVHNFVSNLAGGKRVSSLYRRLVEARRCKIVLLSGTPLVNEPEEVAYLANLVAGPIVVHDVPLPDPRGLTADAEASLRAHPDVHEAWEEQRDGGARLALCVRLVPEGFERAPGDAAGTFVVRLPEAQGIRKEPAQLASALSSAGLSSLLSGARRREVELLPSDAIEFRSAYVDGTNDQELTLKNADELGRRLLGTVSFFRDQDASLYPELRSVKLVQLPLSPRQFTEYTTQRTGERRREEAARRFAAMRGNQQSSKDDSGVGMRPFSRAVCTFVFPEGIPRPRRGDPSTYLPDSLVTSPIKSLSATPQQANDAETEAEDDTDEDENLGSRVSREYSHALDRAVEALRHLPPERLLASGGLSDLSPKFEAIVASLKALQGEGTALVYSQFRRAEGVAILAVALEANGFAQLSFDRLEGGVRARLMLGGRPVPTPIPAEVLARPRYVMYSNDDREAAAALLSVFNNRPSDAPQSVRDSLLELMPKTMKKSAKTSKRTSAKTTSTDENSLSNLLGQVACAMLITRSGSEGIQTRNVRQVHVIEPFWHANRIDQVIGRARRLRSHDDLPPSERTVDVRIYLATFDASQAKSNRRDNYLTSDQHVHEVAQRKRKLLKSLLDVMSAAAVDCVANREAEAAANKGKSGKGKSKRTKGMQCVAAPGGASASPDAPMYDVKGL
jgi:hypothetical protein